jgi:DNA ligase-1
MTKTLKTLYHRGSKGAIYSWRIWTEGADIVTEYGQVDGKKQLARKTAEAKNIGKSNETTPEGQALLEAKSMWTFKVERKYRKTLKEAEQGEIFLPMLAAKFAARKGKKKDGHTYPCDVQPKLDGLRALACWQDGRVVLLSRSGKEYNCPHITEELLQTLPKGMVLDGEMYKRGIELQTINSWVKKLRPETVNIEFHVYDCVFPGEINLEWPNRWERLSGWFAENKGLKSVVEVETHTVETEDAVYELQSQFLHKGLEGAVVRMYDNSAYKFGYRSKRLLKVKSWVDAEFQVTGYTNGVGKFKDCVIWTCVTGQSDGSPTPGIEFETTPIGTMEERAEMLRNADSFIGKWLKVKFANYTPDGKPFHSNGICFRLPEDM